jgi:alanyl-tRNA synthetase
MTDAEIRKVEAIVNDEILANAACQAREMGIDDAQKTGAMMLFGEKYGDVVRVIDIGSSIELCGGTHVKRTGDIGLFKIVAESGVAAGVRRVEAITGETSLEVFQNYHKEIGTLASELGFNAEEIRELNFELGFSSEEASEGKKQVQKLKSKLWDAEKEIAQLKSKLASLQGDELLAQAQAINGVNVLAAKLDGADAAVLRETMDKLKDKLKTAVILLAAVSDGKVSLIAGVTADATAKVKAGELVNFVAQQVGGKGGGRADMAQAGGTQPEHLSAALASVSVWVKPKL